MTKARVIAIANNKGGVGKTATTLSIGSIMAKKGYKVLLVDLDSQANLTQTFYVADCEPEVSIYHMITRNAPLNIRKVQTATLACEQPLHMIPASLELSVLDREISARSCREQLLQRILAPCLNHYDLILLDCPPALTLIVQMALYMSDCVLVPATETTYSIRGIKLMDRYLEYTAEDFARAIPVLGILITQHRATNLAARAAQTMEELWPGKLFSTKISHNVKMAESAERRKTIYDYDPRSAAALGYAAVADELISRMADMGMPISDPIDEIDF